MIVRYAQVSVRTVTQTSISKGLDFLPNQIRRYLLAFSTAAKSTAVRNCFNVSTG